MLYVFSACVLGHFAGSVSSGRGEASSLGDFYKKKVNLERLCGTSLIAPPFTWYIFLFQVGRDDVEDMSQLFPRNNNELVQCSGKHKIIGILCGGRLLPSVLIDPFQWESAC